MDNVYRHKLDDGKQCLNRPYIEQKRNI